MGGIRARQGNVTVELDSVLSDKIDEMLREMAPTVTAEMDRLLKEARTYVQASYPRANDARFKTATGNSFDAFQYFRTIEQKNGGLIIQVSVENDASNFGKISRLRGRRADLQARLEGGEELNEAELRELRVIQALENIKGRKGLIPYVVFVHRGRYWQTLRKMRKEAEQAIIDAAAAELRRIAGG
tara:strand:- start:2758 stop:3315 length:558 start_codon:yes stop_codon:yes gene_type:complete